MNPFGLGGQEREYDSRDHSPESYGSASPYPSSYESPIKVIYSQKHKPACGSHSGAQATNVLFNVTTSPKFGWKEIKLIDGVRPQDGTTMDAIFKEMKDTGYCDLTLMDNNTEDSVSLADYTDPYTIDSAMIQNASTRKITGYAFTNTPTMEQIKQAIYQFKAVILLVNVTDAWWKPSYAEKDILPLRVGNFVGRHFICCTGYDENFIKWPNSWGTEWGKDGRGYFDNSFIPQVIEMGVAILDKKYQFNKNLWFGMVSDPDVQALQIRLGVTPTTGNFWYKTFWAVIAYQRAHGIFPTSVVNEETRKSLNG